MSPKSPFGSHPGMLPRFSSTRNPGDSRASTAATDPADLTVDEESPVIPHPVGNDEENLPSPQPRSYAKKSRNSYYIHKEKDSTTKTTSSKRSATAEDLPRRKLAKRSRTSHFESDDDDLYSDLSAAAPLASTYEGRTTGRDRKGPTNYYATEAEKRLIEAIESQRSGRTVDDDVIESQEKPLPMTSRYAIDLWSQDSVIDRGIPAGETSAKAQPTPLSHVEDEWMTATRPPAALRPTTLAPVEERQSSGTRTHQATPTTPRLPRPKLNYSYSIIFSRTPVLSTKNWYPQGSFQDKTLAQVFLDLELDVNVRGVVFTLEGPDLRYEGGLIDRGDETKFQVMKRNLTRWINICSDSHRGTSEPLDLFIDIEILRDEEEGLHVDEEDAEIW
ncbi:uncharacterized protein BDZ99DRAFT_474002 [Mytilinidion resinicola]|uniref:Uncharacterized protein n=1 Tax=Mytilinidion resinicola TaxID=574789 RepID=A0A6A6YY18_9PEZI|nr:uncharacterized protein BDZ99DRAFT_474002 [Mytilinidion resinicola]KAF2813323.1 hypothetical protein BDZ99DRAFT_474002 [Mytilinidion resinicola]